MRKEQFVLPYFVYDDMCELNEQDADLLQQAHTFLHLAQLLKVALS